MHCRHKCVQRRQVDPPAYLITSIIPSEVDDLCHILLVFSSVRFGFMTQALHLHTHTYSRDGACILSKTASIGLI
jgi:hypothetical protein